MRTALFDVVTKHACVRQTDGEWRSWVSVAGGPSVKCGKQWQRQEFSFWGM